MADATSIPSKFTAKTTVEYVRTFSDYPADGGWTLTVYLSGKDVLAGGSGKAAVAEGSSFRVKLLPADTTLSAGTYLYSEVVTDGTDTFEVTRGWVTIEASSVGAAAGALQSQIEQDLVVVRAALAGRLTKDMESYQIAGRAVTKIGYRDLIAVEAWLEGKLARLVSGKPAPSVTFAFREPE